MYVCIYVCMHACITLCHNTLWHKSPLSQHFEWTGPEKFLYSQDTLTDPKNDWTPWLVPREGPGHPVHPDTTTIMAFSWLLLYTSACVNSGSSLLIPEYAVALVVLGGLLLLGILLLILIKIIFLILVSDWWPGSDRPGSWISFGESLNTCTLWNPESYNVNGYRYDRDGCF